MLVVGSDSLGGYNLFSSEEIGMGACPDKMKSTALNAVYEKPVRLDMAFPAIFQCALKWMVFVFCRQGRSLSKALDDPLKALNILSSFLGPFNIPLELARPEHHIHGLTALHSKVLKKLLDILKFFTLTFA